MESVNNPQKSYVDIIIDQVTPCLINKKSGKEVKTNFEEIPASDVKKLNLRNWNFNWILPTLEGYSVYALTLLGKLRIQGLIALKRDNDNSAIDINIVESAPHNKGNNRIYLGVGAHLFAIASKLSFEWGFNGWAYFDAKTNLIEHYIKELGAERLGSTQRMQLSPKASQMLVDRYFNEEGI